MPTPPPTPGPLDLIEALEVATNRDDVDAVLDLFVDGDEGLWFNVSGVQANDKEVLRWAWELLTVLHEDEYRDCQQEGDKVNCTIHNRGICRRAEGFDLLHIDVSFRFQDQKILSMVGDVVPGELQGHEEATSRMHEWYAANRPVEFQKYVNPVAAGLTGGQFGELVVGLCSDYLEATAQ